MQTHINLILFLSASYFTQCTNGIHSSWDEKTASISRDTEKKVSSLQNSQPPPGSCDCGGPGLWTRIAHLDMSNPNEQCPSTDWEFHNTPVRACGRTPGGAKCDSATFPSNNQSYSRVCGRVNAYQEGSTDAFAPSINSSPGLENAYVDGVSLTHGAAGSRQHIWTFTASIAEQLGNYPTSVCPCTDVLVSWPPNSIPSFVNNSYFCESGNPGPSISFTDVYVDDILWDGKGCGPINNTCCCYAPWFCVELPAATKDDLEVRICHDEDDTNENVLVSLIDIFVKIV